MFSALIYPDTAQIIFSMTEFRIPRCLTIAGSDSGGGAGIQGDLKTFTVLGTYGMSAITALTAQNTQGVTQIHELPPEFVAEQIRVVMEDIGCDAAKTGMLANAAIVRAVARTWRQYARVPLVVDPVMVSTTGARLLAEDAIEALVTELFPLSTIVTPNASEAALLANIAVADLDSSIEAARRIYSLGARAVLVKGGDSPAKDEQVHDVLFDGKEIHIFMAPRIATPHTHGSGCALASAICANLARGLSLKEAVEKARKFILWAITSAKPLGHGHGPVNHLAWLGQQVP